MPCSTIFRDSTVVASRWVKVVAGAGVGEVVGGDVHRLHRGDGPALGGGDALLEGAHLVGQGGLIAHGGGMRPMRADTSLPAWT